MNITIRQATKEDASLIADISHQTFYDAFAADNTKADMDKFLTEQFTKDKLMQEVGATQHIFLLAFEGDEAVGYVKLREGYTPSLLGNGNAIEIARIYAKKNSIGKGVGKVMMQASITVALEKEKNSIWLGVWEKNKRAIAFYTNWGFEKFDETDFLLGNDLQRDWLMKKQLL